jgi:hypothetical protein
VARPEHIYVYYRRRGDAMAARAAVGALFADIESRTGVSGRLLARGDDAETETWMEIYEPVTRPATFLRLLAARVQRLGLPEFAADGRRNLERFVAVDPIVRARRAR